MKKLWISFGLFVFFLNLSVARCLDNVFIDDLNVGDHIDSSMEIVNVKDEVISDRVMLYDEETVTEVILDENGVYSIKVLEEYNGWYVSNIVDNQLFIKPYVNEVIGEVYSEEIEDPFLNAPNPNTIDSIYIVIACLIAVVFSLVYSIIKVMGTRKYDL